jgi:hypothetical protein
MSELKKALLAGMPLPLATVKPEIRIPGGTRNQGSGRYRISDRKIDYPAS